MQEVYIRLYKTSKIQGKPKVLISDVARVSGPTKLQAAIEGLCVLQPYESKHKHYAVSIIDVIQKIHEQYPDVTIQSVGEMDGVVDYNGHKEKQQPVWEWVKVALVCLVVFAGTAIAIMAYQTDVSLRETFCTLYEIFTGEVTDNPVWITVPYSIGMPLGILVFFNHIGSKKLTDDPTPIEVEIDTYEKQVDDTIIDTLTEAKRGQTQ
ncbi:MAG: stage V sporulation protein AA [Cellulosilyticaceae bacterium]